MGNMVTYSFTSIAADGHFKKLCCLSHFVCNVMNCPFWWLEEWTFSSIFIKNGPGRLCVWSVFVHVDGTESLRKTLQQYYSYSFKSVFFCSSPFLLLDNIILQANNCIHKKSWLYENSSSSFRIVSSWCHHDVLHQQLATTVQIGTNVTIFSQGILIIFLLQQLSRHSRKLSGA